RVGGDDRAHAAAWGGEGHLDGDDLFAVLLFDGAVVHEAEVDDVDRDLGIVNALELGPDLFFERRVLEADGFGVLLLFLFRVDAEGIGILRGNAGKAGGGGDGVGTAEALGDEDGCAGGQGDGVAAGDLDGFDLAG